jgi:hypothetical protein
MRGLLPDQILAPRATRTGVSSSYFERSMQARVGSLLAEVDDCSYLSDLGIIDRGVLRRSWERFRNGGARQSGLGLFLTLQAEMWLRAHAQGLAAVPSVQARSQHEVPAMA